MDGLDDSESPLVDDRQDKRMVVDPYSDGQVAWAQYDSKSKCNSTAEVAADGSMLQERDGATRPTDESGSGGAWPVAEAAAANAASGMEERGRITNKQIKDILVQLNSLTINLSVSQHANDGADETANDNDERRALIDLLNDTLQQLRQLLRGKPHDVPRKSTAERNKSQQSTIDNRTERRKMFSIQLEERYHEELDKLSERFRHQKIELIKILQVEKSELQERLKLERHSSIDEIERTHEQKLSDERQIWQNIVKEYQKEVDVIRFELHNIQRNCNVAIEELKCEHEQQLLELHAGQQQERRQWRQVVTDKVISRMVQTQFGSRTHEPFSS